MSLPAIMEPCPQELAQHEFPQYGGSLFFNEHGIAGCPQCGWTGVPTITGGNGSVIRVTPDGREVRTQGNQPGTISTRCPACHPVTQEQLLSDYLEATPWTLTATPARRVPRNQPCPCGSGTKAKRCACAQYAV